MIRKIPWGTNRACLGLSDEPSKAWDVSVRRDMATVDRVPDMTTNATLRLARSFGAAPRVRLNLQKTWERRWEEVESGLRNGAIDTPQEITGCATQQPPEALRLDNCYRIRSMELIVFERVAAAPLFATSEIGRRGTTAVLGNRAHDSHALPLRHRDRI